MITLLNCVLPRGRSKTAFLLVMTCYEIAINSVAEHLTALFYYWPVAARFLRGGLPPMPNHSPVYVIGSLLIAPLIESSIMIAMIEALRRMHFNLAIQIIASVSLICAMHSMSYSLWGFFVAPQFAIEVGTYLYWRRSSVWTGAQMMIALHFFYNVYATLYVISRSA